MLTVFKKYWDMPQKIVEKMIVIILVLVCVLSLLLLLLSLLMILPLLQAQNNLGKHPQLELQSYSWLRLEDTITGMDMKRRSFFLKLLSNSLVL